MAEKIKDFEDRQDTSTEPKPKGASNITWNEDII